jgi:hypothetical protein
MSRRLPHPLPRSTWSAPERITVTVQMLDAFRVWRLLQGRCRCGSIHSDGDAPCAACEARSSIEQRLRRLFHLQPWEPVITEQAESEAPYDRDAFRRFRVLEDHLRLARRLQRAAIP